MYQDPVRFKLNLRDFLVSLKEFSEDQSELFIEDKEAEANRQKEAERAKASAVPGMIKVSSTSACLLLTVLTYCLAGRTRG